MNLYKKEYLDRFTQEYGNKITGEINSKNDNYILTVNVDDYISYLLQKYTLDTPELHFDQVHVDTVERDIPGSRFPMYEFTFLDTSKMFRKEVIIYHIPYSGDIGLLQFKPNPCSLRSYEAKFDTLNKCLLIEVINFYNDAEKIKQQYNLEVNDLLSNYNGIRNNCKTFNDGLEPLIRNAIEFRKQQVLRKSNLLASLGVPIKKKEGIAESFSVPKPRLKDKIIVEPVVAEKNFKPEPALDESNFRKILKVINDAGKNLERMPSIYKEKSEEDIRDFILFTLDPNFELGSAGGETFNKIGKTDISLRYDSSVVFIAECKYWKGEKAYLKAIDQLLGYLTWRNSKVAVINFVQSSEFTDILAKVKIATQKHPNFLKELNEKDEAWFNYKFHLNGDRNRELYLAVISFHLPK